MSPLPNLEYRAETDDHPASPSGVAVDGALLDWRPISVLLPSSTASPWACHLPFAAWLTDILRPSVVVDLSPVEKGVLDGFMRAARRLRLDARCYALAPATEDEISLPPPAHLGLGGKIRISCPPATVPSDIADGSVDILVLDAVDAPVLLREILEIWRPKLSSKGVVLFCGVAGQAPDPALWSFWLDVSRRHPSFVFPHGGGLAVLGLGTDLPAALSRLFRAARLGGEAQNAIALLFERLGQPSPFEMEMRLAVARAQNQHLEAQLDAMRASTSWRVTRPLRSLGYRLGALRRKLRPSALPVQAPAMPSVADQEGAYAIWVQHHDTLGLFDMQAITGHIARFERMPKLSVVMPVYNISEKYLRRALDTVVGQLYENWELCIADDASPKPHIREVLTEYAARDPRIKVVFRPENGHVAVATNSALAIATGDYVVLMDHDDELPAHCLYMIALEINHHPDAEIIYSDEDKIDAEGRRRDPYFKTDWNLDLVRGQNMISHVGVYKRALLEKIGGFRKGFEGSQDYDLMLRAVEQVRPDQIRHIPFILYHWRVFASSGSISTDQLDMATSAARRAVAEHLARTGSKATVGGADGAPEYSQVRHPLPDPLPLVSLIVPTRDKVELLAQCVTGLLDRTDYGPVEVLIVDNGSVEERTRAYFRSLADEPRVRVLSYDGPFNYSAINNFAAAQAKGQVIGLINNDIDVIEPGWLKEMVSHALRPDVGAVGAKLYYGDDTIQHAGVILGMGGVAGHPFRQFPKGAFYFQRPNLAQNISAVTAACLVVRKDVFDEVGGLDEVNLPVAFNDVDFCIRLREAGYLNVWTPFAELHHLESQSRGDDLSPAHLARFKREIAYMETRWGKLLAKDPYYNPNLAADRTDFSLAFPPRIAKPWREEDAGGL